ncbi:hypothetical protein BKA56DRAFT_663719 [Ilyonectria sp. MPI-CAGE-AT-0026]|nr:hypothetical protein BKA56DRAFT_663719 [Ilyonectria sp. MPI-CAGE-AT-0026]
MLLSSSIAPKPRRRPVQKSFSGCSQCKARKIKCDENKPSCTPCNIKRVACPGYPVQPRLRWSRKHEVLEPRDFVSNDQTRPPNNERRESAISESSPSDTTNSTVGDGDWVTWAQSTEAQGPGAPGSACSSGEHTSISDEFNSAHALDILSPTVGVTVGRGDGLLYTSADSDEIGSFSVEQLLNTFMNADNTAPVSSNKQLSISELSDSSPGHLPYGTDAEEEARQDAFLTKAPVELFNVESECTSAYSQPQLSTYGSESSFGFQGSENGIQLSVAPQLVHLPSELVGIYFSVVCPILSTYDSEQNIFRTAVSQKWQHSASDIARASSWSSELIFNVLLLGISSSWFDIADLGIQHLAAAQQAVLNYEVDYSDGLLTIGFFKNALIYWEMVSCAVNDNVTSHNYSKVNSLHDESFVQSQKSSPISRPRIKPHPWTGVTSEPQVLFTRVSRQIRCLRRFGSTPGLSLDNPDDFADAVKSLDTAIWACHLPMLHDISSIGDENTPAIHHLLLAEAYMFANLYQLYCIFANVRRRRVRWIRETTDFHGSQRASWANGQVSVWASILQRDDGIEKWLKFLGRSIIIRLEQIQTSSGTSCVQALLLLVAATSLSASLDNDEEEEIREARQFVLDRLANLSRSNLSTPITYVRSVVLEIFKRLDVGVDVFWMDVLQSMGTVTIIG